MSGSLGTCPISPVSQILTLIRLEFIHQRTPIILASDFRQTNDCVVSLCLLRDMLIPLSFDEIIINFVRNQRSRSSETFVMSRAELTMAGLIIAL